MDELKQYKEKTDELKKFKEEHADVMSNFEEINKEISDLADVIKAISKKTMEDSEYENVKVSVSRRAGSSYDWAQISVIDRALLEVEGAIEHKVDKKIFDALVEAEKISREARQKAYVEKTPVYAVSIKVS